MSDVDAGAAAGGMGCVGTAGGMGSASAAEKEQQPLRAKIQQEQLDPYKNFTQPVFLDGVKIDIRAVSTRTGQYFLLYQDLASVLTGEKDASKLGDYLKYVKDKLQRFSKTTTLPTSTLLKQKDDILTIEHALFNCNEVNDCLTDDVYYHYWKQVDGKGRLLKYNAFSIAAAEEFITHCDSGNASTNKGEMLAMLLQVQQQARGKASGSKALKEAEMADDNEGNTLQVAGYYNKMFTIVSGLAAQNTTGIQELVKCATGNQALVKYVTSFQAQTMNDLVDAKHQLGLYKEKAEQLVVVCADRDNLQQNNSVLAVEVGIYKAKTEHLVAVTADRDNLQKRGFGLALEVEVLKNQKRAKTEEFTLITKKYNDQEVKMGQISSDRENLQQTNSALALEVGLYKAKNEQLVAVTTDREDLLKKTTDLALEVALYKAKDEQLVAVATDREDLLKKTADLALEVALYKAKDEQLVVVTKDRDDLQKSNLALALDVAVLKEQTRLRTEELNAINDTLADVTDDRDTLFKQTLDIKAKNDRLEEQEKMIKKLRGERDATYKSYLEMEAEKKLLFKENTHMMRERDSLQIQNVELTRAKARTDEVAKPRTSDDEVGTRSDEQQDTGCYAYVCHAGY